MAGATVDNKNDAQILLLGEIKGKMDSVLDRLDKVEKKVDSVVAMTNRWKGMTTILIVIGGGLGWAFNFFAKFLPGNHGGA
jgi:hypothetical protein